MQKVDTNSSSYHYPDIHKWRGPPKRSVLGNSAAHLRQLRSQMLSMRG